MDIFGKRTFYTVKHITKKAGIVNGNTESIVGDASFMNKIEIFFLACVIDGIVIIATLLYVWIIDKIFSD